MSTLRKDGLTNEVYNKMIKVFQTFPEVQKVILYGSRARGNYKAGSDIDLSLIGDQLETSHQLKIENALDDLLLPYKMDISLYENIDNENLRQNIDREGVVFYILKS
jgi:uncharacterized protein